MDLEASRSLTYYAAWALENEESDAPRAASAATAYCTEQCTDLFSHDIFNHGALGYTWDYDGHIFLKQAKSWENLLGTPEQHRERVADARL
jgi:alkylation response protein AidB-like acyl-CoA dehydrogenase